MFATRVPSTNASVPSTYAIWGSTFNRITEHQVIIKMSNEDIDFAVALRDRGFPAEYVSRRITHRVKARLAGARIARNRVI